MSARTFWQIDVEKRAIVAEYTSSTPREAALKAATRDFATVCLVDTGAGKLHVFSAQKKRLDPSEENAYTRRRNISHKPIVTKLAYHSCKRAITKNDIDSVSELFLDII